MNDLADLIIKIRAQKLRDESRLHALEAEIVEVRDAITTATEELSQLQAALQIAFKRGSATPADLESVQAVDDSPSVEQSPVVDSQAGKLAGREEEDGTKAGSRARKKLIDAVYELTHNFGGEEFTTGDVRRRLAEVYPELFATINPASVSGTLARIYQDYNQEHELERVGIYGNEMTYRRKVKPTTKEDTPIGNPPP